MKLLLKLTEYKLVEPSQKHILYSTKAGTPIKRCLSHNIITLYVYVNQLLILVAWSLPLRTYVNCWYGDMGFTGTSNNKTYCEQNKNKQDRQSIFIETVPYKSV